MLDIRGFTVERGLGRRGSAHRRAPLQDFYEASYGVALELRRDAARSWRPNSRCFLASIELWCCLCGPRRRI